MSELTYSTYLKIDELLELQKPQTKPAEHDEMLFIVIHQTYELWFKLLLQEFVKVRADFLSGDLYGAMQSFKRARMVMKSLVGQLDIIETMTPLSFNSFRARLDSASGFQSVQFRELEFILGYKRSDMLKHHQPNTRGYQALWQRLREISVVDAFYDFLEHNGVDVPAVLRDRDVTLPTTENEDVQNALVAIYRTKPDVAILLELMTDFDEGLQEWRYRHVKMVERTIGTKSGTGGSLGVGFLRKSLFNPVFPDLWAIRSRF